RHACKHHPSLSVAGEKAAAGRLIASWKVAFAGEVLDLVRPHPIDAKSIAQASLRIRRRYARLRTLLVDQQPR
ncbi:hypothetical protein, partial [Xanthomonas hortorum]